jgi:hypothetical protein
VPRIAASIADTSPENRARRHQIAHRRPSSGQTEPTGAPRVSPRSSWTPPPSSSHAVAAAMAGRRRCLGADRPGPLPSRPGQRGQPMWPGPHLSASVGQMTLGVKSSATRFYFQKNCCKCLKFVKCIEYSLFVRKMQMTNQNVQKNEIYILV